MSETNRQPGEFAHITEAERCAVLDAARDTFACLNPDCPDGGQQDTLTAAVERVVADRTDATAREYGTRGWNACASAVRALIAAGRGDTVSIYDLEAMFQAAEDEGDDDA